MLAAQAAATGSTTVEPVPAPPPVPVLLEPAPAVPGPPPPRDPLPPAPGLASPGPIAPTHDAPAPQASRTLRSAAVVWMTGYRLLVPGWRGALLGWFTLVWIANVYMSLFGRLRLDIKRERVEIKAEEKEQELKFKRR